MGFQGLVSFGSNPQDPAFSVNINSTAFNLFGLEVKWYGVLIGLGMVLAMTYVFKRCKSFGINIDKFIDVLLVGVVGGIVGARAYYVIFAWDEFKGESFLDVISLRDGGLAIYGGIIGAFLVAIIMCKLKRIKLLPVLDMVSIAFLIGQAIGRWGNFMNQEAFGDNTTLPWGMYSENTKSYLATLASQGQSVDPTMPVHPCFLYESIWCLVGFVLLHFFSKKFKKYDGQVLLVYLAWYGLGRCIIEGLRTDSLMMGPYRVSQLLAGLCVVICLVLLFAFRNKNSIYGEEGLALEMQEDARIKEEKESKKASKGKKEEAKTIKKNDNDEAEDNHILITSDDEQENNNDNDDTDSDESDSDD